MRKIIFQKGGGGGLIALSLDPPLEMNVIKMAGFCSGYSCRDTQAISKAGSRAIVEVPTSRGYSLMFSASSAATD